MWFVEAMFPGYLFTEIVAKNADFMLSFLPIRHLRDEVLGGQGKIPSPVTFSALQKGDGAIESASVLRRLDSPVQFPLTHSETKESQAEQHDGRSPVRHSYDQLVLSRLSVVHVTP